MQVLLLLVLVLNSNLVIVNSEIYEIFPLQYIKDLFLNKTKEINEDLGERFLGNANYYDIEDDAKYRGIDDHFEEMSNHIYTTVNGYFKQVDDAKKSIMNSFNRNVINTEVFTQYDPEVYLDTMQLIVKNGYPAEAHTVKTTDGYLLTMHRIPYAKSSKNAVANKKTVYLQHGLLGSSSNYVTSGAQKGLAYILSEAGYDVWMGNYRGNTYSRAHVSLNIKNSSFWNFTWHDMAMYDLPAMIDHVNKVKQLNKELYYIGHSMGTTTLFVLLSMRPEYNNKLKAAYAMAPVAYMTSVQSPIKMLAPFANNIEWIAEYLGADEFAPQNAIFKWLADVGCKINNFNEKVCRNLLFLIAGFDPMEFNNDKFPVILSHTPAGTSTKTVVHYAQEIRDGGKFQQFDYGAEKNIKVYGRPTPPEYPTYKITLPIALICADNDLLNSMDDSKLLYKALKNPIELYEVPMKEFNHLDFLWGIDAPTLVYDKILKLMEQSDKQKSENWFSPIFKKWA